MGPKRWTKQHLRGLDRLLPALARPSPIFALHDSARSTLLALMKGHCVAVALLELIPQRGGLGGLSLGRLGGLSLGR